MALRGASSRRTRRSDRRALGGGSIGPLPSATVATGVLSFRKVDGSQRPLGVAALEDKIVQQAVVTVLTAIYEADFLLWIPARAQPASSVGRSLGRAQPEESELGARRRHQVVLGSCLILPSTL